MKGLLLSKMADIRTINLVTGRSLNMQHERMPGLYSLVTMYFQISQPPQDQSLETIHALMHMQSVMYTIESALFEIWKDRIE